MGVTPTPLSRSCCLGFSGLGLLGLCPPPPPPPPPCSGGSSATPGSRVEASLRLDALRASAQEPTQLPSPGSGSSTASPPEAQASSGSVRAQRPLRCQGPEWRGWDSRVRAVTLSAPVPAVAPGLCPTPTPCEVSTPHTWMSSLLRTLHGSPVPSGSSLALGAWSDPAMFPLCAPPLGASPFVGLSGLSCASVAPAPRSPQHPLTHPTRPSRHSQLSDRGPAGPRAGPVWSVWVPTLAQLGWAPA